VTETFNVQRSAEARDLVDEMRRQLERWGKQSYPPGTSEVYREACDLARAECDQAERDGRLTWFHILKEEFFEVASEEDDRRLEKELIQVMAVCGSWLRDLREKRGHRGARVGVRSGDRVTVDSGLNHDGPVTGTAEFVDEVTLHVRDEVKKGLLHVYAWEDVANLTVTRGREHQDE